jgi:predicted XRE-type DNA-binding protein
MAIKITKGSDNVFRDLGRKLTQAQAAKLLGVTQPRVSDLVRGRLHRFSIDALVEMLARAGVKVHLSTERGSRVA